MQDPYAIVKSRYVTEKAVVLENLHNAKSNRSLSRCDHPRYVFLVDQKANKPAIARAVESIYSSLNIKVVAVNTITIKRKPRRVRGRPGFKAGFKKAIVTLQPGDSLDAV